MGIVLIVDGVTIASGSVTGTFGPVTAITNFVAGNTDSGGNMLAGDDGIGTWDVCHVSVHRGAAGPWSSAMSAYPGEAAHTRFTRVCAEEGIPCSTSATESRVVGPQPAASVMDVLRDLETVDHGMLTELITDWGLGYRAYTQRVNLAAALTVDLSTYRASGDLGSVLIPVRNDRGLRNEWVISRPGGGSATFKDTASQAKRGRYDDSGQVNVAAESQLLDDASWHVHEGTYDGWRYDTVPIDMAANPSDLLVAWLAASIGDRIDRTHYPSPPHMPESSTQVLIGYRETLSRRGWMVDATTEPYEPWRVGVFAADSPGSDPAGIGWFDYDTCTLAVSVNTSATSWSITCSPADSSDSNDYPRRHYIGGELITVTASTGGLSPTWTVTRSVNTVSKAHTAGAAITLADALIFAL